MDSREVHGGRQQPPPPQGMMMSQFTAAFGHQHFPNSSLMTMIQGPNLAFGPMGAPVPQGGGALMNHHHQQQHQQHQNQNLQPPQNSKHQPQNGSVSGVSAGGGSSGCGGTMGLVGFGGGGNGVGSSSGGGAEQVKKKRGRPRKYSPDNIILGLASSPAGGQSDDVGEGNLDGGQERKQRGRPPGSGKKQLDALGGTGGVGFTPHVIMVQTGEDIVAKLIEFAQEGPRTLIILSANGTVCNVTLRQLTASGGIHFNEGLFEIIHLSGSFCSVNSGGIPNRMIYLSISMATPDGKVLGGGVAGELIAASSIQIVIGSFISDRKKASASIPNASSVPTPPPPHMLNFGSGLVRSNKATPNDAASESSDENGGHHLNHTPSPYNNSSHHGMQQMYQPQFAWANSGMGVLSNRQLQHPHPQSELSRDRENDN